MRTHLLLGLLISLTACGGSTAPSGSDVPAGHGLLAVHLTDAPGEWSEVVVTIDGISVHVAGHEPVDLELNMDVGLGGAVIDRDTDLGRLTVNLIELANGVTMQLALGAVPAGEIEQIRLHLVEDVIDGTPSPWVLEDVPDAVREPLKVPSGFQSGLKIVPRNVSITGGELNSITLDFDAAKSVVSLGGKGRGNRAYDYLLKPVIFVLESESLTRAPTTIATGLNFPMGLTYLAGADDDDTDDAVVVANAGTASSGGASNAKSFVVLWGSEYAEDEPVDATGLKGVESTATEGAPRDAASAEALDGDGMFDGVAGASLFNFDVDSLDTPDESDLSPGDLTAVVPTTQPDGEGKAWFLARADEILYADPDADEPVVLDVDVDDITGLAFFPDDPTDTFGTLVATDRGEDADDASDDRILIIPVDVADDTIEVSGEITVIDATDIAFMNEPIGVAANVDGTGFFVAQRGNGFIHEISLEAELVRVLDTGLGADSLAGIAVVANPELEGLEDEDEVILLSNTNGNDDPDSDDPLDEDADSTSTIEALVP
ncbi:MAG: DUF4382 domain-containing protein [Planctomycetota bacterium]|jgi:hypothetical protein